MSIETTHMINRQVAIRILKERGVVVFDDDCPDRLAHLLYEIRESECENYNVVDHTYDEEMKKEYPWPYWKH